MSPAVLAITGDAADRGIVFAVLGFALALFLWGQWRYDIVAVIGLMVVTVAGIVPAQEAFLGFGHPAVVTVGAVLVISRALVISGAVDLLANQVGRLGERPFLHLAGLTGLVAVLSAFMNNVGALALLMPVSIRLAQRGGYSPSVTLMPLAFGSLLGGMATMIGTPPNVIVGSIRQQNGQDAFGMFDFAPVGAGIAVAGVLFIWLASWRLVPRRTSAAGSADLFETSGFLAELTAIESSKAVGMSVDEVEGATDGAVVVAGLVREGQRMLVPAGFERLRAGDVLLVEADSTALEAAVADLGVELSGRGSEVREQISSDAVEVAEAVVLPRSMLEGRSATSFGLRRRFGVNLLAVARRGSRLRGRVGAIRLAAGDVLLLQGSRETLSETIQTLGCAPLAVRVWQPEKRGRLLLSAGLFAAALGLTAGGVLEVQVALATAALMMILLGIIDLKESYEAIDWPVLVLLGGMIPIGGAMQTTGGAELIADQLFRVGGDLPPIATIALLLVVTMLLSDLVNNAAAAVVMAPIGIGLAAGLGVSADPYLMAVAIGASCAFLTPIGHQSNTLVLGPGGYRFGDYWRLGLPLQLVIVAVALPLLLVVWPP